jgi:protein-tyrosine-phosphatase
MAAAASERALVALARLLTPALARVLAAGPVQRRLRGRALAAWDGAEEPLVLCYGNINRSPFAAELARAVTSARPRSSGLYHGTGRPASDLALQEARRRGVDLSAHRSTLVTRAQLRAAAAVFVFDFENVARVARRSPAALAKTHLFASLSPAGSPIVADPHGREPRVASGAFAQIAAIVDVLASRPSHPH